ncbi:MAG: hypothetical protein DMD73_00815 [Gemmatimonadetes bacterium]|nr:MAG: hypothetical protein DMD73_00815 [Gemmatimonadota bacterium]
MTWVSTRTLPPIGLLVSLGAGCVHRHDTNPPTAPPSSVVTRGSNEPLYVIDGVEIEPGPGGSLTGINPRDIATIEVVKDPAGEAMYGVRGANGVIIIRTKRPDQ